MPRAPWPIIVRNRHGHARAMGAGFDAATSTPTGVDVQLTGHQVVLGSSGYGG